MVTDEEANSFTGGSGSPYPDGHEVVSDDVVSNRRLAHLVDRSDGTGHRSERTLHPAQTPLSVTKWRGRRRQRRSIGDPRTIRDARQGRTSCISDPLELSRRLDE